MHQDARKLVYSLVDSIHPFDEIERWHKEDTLAWIKSDAEIFRLQKPDIPPKHLVSYFVVIDTENGKLLLLDHVKAQLLLPSGGHIEKNEDPRATVEREIIEELHMTASFVIADPLFITETITVGLTAGHTDVSLWYVVKGDSNKELTYDPKEFNGYQWLTFQEVLDIPIDKLDPHMHRFVRKLLRQRSI